MSQVKTFWIKPTELERIWLRRYVSSAEKDRACPLPHGYHEAKVLIGDKLRSEKFEKPLEDDPRWPTHCACGAAFTAEDPYQVFDLHLYEGAPDGLLYSLRDAPAGAMWDAEWLHEFEGAVGPDGISLHVKLPNGHDWNVDAEASNCTRTQWGPGTYLGQDGVERTAEKMWKGRTHYCWVRRGDPRTGNITVGKFGDTCGAGAGSILSGSYHGFLTEGFLRSC